MTEPKDPKEYLPPISQRQAQEIYRMVQALQNEIIKDYEAFRGTAIGLIPPFNENPHTVRQALDKRFLQSQDDLIHRTEVIKRWLQLFFDEDKAVMWG